MRVFTIPGTLPGLNEYTLANRSNRFGGAKMKRDAENVVRAAICAEKVKHIDGRYALTAIWAEPNRRRDPDNIQMGVKFILDALVSLGIVDGDGQRHVGSITHIIGHDKANPHIVVTLTEVPE